MFGEHFTLILIGIAAGYLLPAAIAMLRKHPLRWPLAIANILLGWTLVGYAICFIIAVWPLPKGE